jgi:hypothetical protein
MIILELVIVCIWLSVRNVPRTSFSVGWVRTKKKSTTLPCIRRIFYLMTASIITLISGGPDARQTPNAMIDWIEESNC